MKENFENKRSKPFLSESIAVHQTPEMFNQYIVNLQLSREDLQKKILDVGSDWGYFANEARQRGYGNIFSVDIVHPHDRYIVDTAVELGANKLAVADALKLPFQDATFDVVVSLCSIPNIFIFDARNRNEFRKLTIRALQEMLRVTKQGGEVRLGRVIVKETQSNKQHRAWSRWEQTKKVLDDIARDKKAEVFIDDDMSASQHGSGDSVLIRLRKVQQK